MGQLNRSTCKHRESDPVDAEFGVGDTLGTATGQAENAVESGGWGGQTTDRVLPPL